MLGILAMHAAAFAMPAQAYFNPAAYGGTGLLDVLAWALTFILVDGKMRGLFALLFGASLLLSAEGAGRRGEQAAAVHRRRMSWLLLFGVVHFYLIWWGDILIHLAVVGFVAFAFLRLGARSLRHWIIGLFVVHGLVMLGFSGSYLFVAYEAALPDPLPDKVSDWAVMSPPFAPLPPQALAADLALFRGDYGGIVAHRVVEQGLLPFQMLVMSGLETLAYMLMGMAGIRNGFLTGGWTAARYRSVALWGLGAGGLGYAALAGLLIAEDFHPAAVFSVLFGATVLFRLVMVAGYAALVMLLVRPGGWLSERLAAAGRLAFSNYIGCSLVMTTIFYGYGLSLYGHLGRAALLLPVGLLWLLMLLWPRRWLASHRHGPVEWLWRSLVRRKWQPM